MNLRICAVIPAYDHPRTLSEVVKDVVVSTPYPVLIVDDGSETPVQNSLYSFEVRRALQEGRVRVIRHATNRGKGAALLTAVKDLVARGFTHMVTLDANGLHKGSEIAKLVAEAERFPMDIILGRRDHRDEDSWPMRMAHKLTRLTLTAETGAHIQDPQSGFRLYPLFPLQTREFFTRHYDFEWEVLIRSLWHGTGVREVDVHSKSERQREGETHFRKLTDGLRVTALHLLLLSVTVLRSNPRPRDLGWAVALGAMLGCLPIFGFHTLTVCALSLVLGLNVIAVWLSSHLMAFWLMPLVMLSSLFVGREILGVKPSQGLMGHYPQWFAGAIVVGLISGLVLGTVAFVMARSMQESEPEPSQLELHTGRLILKWFGLGPARAWARWTAMRHYVSCSRARRGLNEFYKLIRPEVRWWARQQLVWRHLWQRLVRELEHISSGHPSSPRASALAAHVGATFKFARDPSVIWIDRPQPQSAVLVPFFGRLAAWDLGPFMKISGHEGTVRYLLGDQIFEHEVERTAEPQRLLREFVAEVEVAVRRDPLSWNNLYPFWSSLN